MGVMLDAPWGGTTYAPATAIDIAAIESAIVARLKSQIAAIEIAHYPDRPESYRMTHRIGAALVQFKSARYGEQRDTAAIIQERVLEFDLTLMMRDLGWSYGATADGPSPGAYAMLEAVRASLTGFRVPGCRKMYPVAEKFVERDQQGGVWIYAISFRLTTMAVEPSSSENFPLFVKGLALEETGETAVQVGLAPFTFDLHGVIQLPNTNILSITVIATGGAELTRGGDFALDNVNGIVTALAGGSASAGETVQIAYSFGERVIAQAGQTAPIA